MSLLLTAGFVAAGVLFGRQVGRALRRRRSAEAGEGDGGKDGTSATPLRSGEQGPDAAPRVNRAAPSRSTKPDKAAPRDTLADFPCQLGDVVIGGGGEEAWLAGALIFSERMATAALFVAPDAGADRAIYVRPKPTPSLVWMLPVPADELTIGREPPSTLEHKGERFERMRRLPLRVERAGTGAPDIGDEAIVADYGSAAGERLLVVIGTGPARVWRGLPLEQGMYDVLPSGKSTLDNP